MFSPVLLTEHQRGTRHHPEITAVFVTCFASCLLQKINGKQPTARAGSSTSLWILSQMSGSSVLRPALQATHPAGRGMPGALLPPGAPQENTLWKSGVTSLAVGTKSTHPPIPMTNVFIVSFQQHVFLTRPKIKQEIKGCH